MRNKIDGEIKIGAVARDALASANERRFQIKTVGVANINGREPRQSYVHRAVPVRSMVMRR